MYPNKSLIHAGNEFIISLTLMFSFAESSQKCGEHSVLVIVDVPFKGLKEKAIPLGQLLAVLYFLI